MAGKNKGTVKKTAQVRKKWEIEKRTSYGRIKITTIGGYFYAKKLSTHKREKITAELQLHDARLIFGTIKSFPCVSTFYLKFFYN